MSESNKKAFYAQSGGVTAVINASACGVIETARENGITVYAGMNGILGALHEELVDTDQESKADIAALRYTPGGAFGSCRYKLKSIDDNRKEYERLVEIFKAHDISYFFYNGGGDSQDTANKVSEFSRSIGYPITCVGIPKTVDNDLPITDNCPGFGSVAKYVATSIREASLDVKSMCSTSTKVFVMEVMGRHAGWIAAAGGLAAETESDGPHIILFPEVTFHQEKFLKKVDDSVKKHGFCAIVVSEGVRDASQQFLSETDNKDAFGHAQLGGVAPVIANLIKQHLGYKYHWAVSDYLQRSARHIASKTDVEQAYTLGKAAVEMALAGDDGMMATIVRESNNPYRWSIGKAPLKDVANVEQPLPPEYISADGFHITPACREYLTPLILGEDAPPYKNGLPDYATLKLKLCEKKLMSFD